MSVQIIVTMVTDGDHRDDGSDVEESLVKMAAASVSV